MVNASMTGAGLLVPVDIDLTGGDVIELEIDDHRLKAQVASTRTVPERHAAACGVQFIDPRPEELHTLGEWMGRRVPHGEMRD